MKTAIKPVLIDQSDGEEENDCSNLSYEEDTISNHSSTSKDIFLIHNTKVESDDPTINCFINFCINEGLFDNTFYDYNNNYSSLSTKLPFTFSKINNSKGTNINKWKFINKFKKDFRFNGDIHFIYKCLDPDSKGYFTWNDFLNFFLPYIEYITVS